MKSVPTLQQKLQAMDRGNVDAARIIAEAKYPEGSLMAEWARLVLGKEQKRAA